MVGGKLLCQEPVQPRRQGEAPAGLGLQALRLSHRLEQGFSPNSIEIDEPIQIGDWEPENYRRQYLGPVTLTKALALSLNTVAAKARHAGHGRSRHPVAAPARHPVAAPNQCLDRARHLGSHTARTHQRLVPFANGGYAGRSLCRHAHHHAGRASVLYERRAMVSARSSPATISAPSTS